MTSPTPAIQLRSVSKHFRDHQVLSQVDVTVASDAITGLLGRNGAGKTTLMRLVTGHDRPSAGNVSVFGADPFENDPVLSQIAFVREAVVYPDGYKVKHALASARIAYARWDEDFAQRLLEDFDLPTNTTIKKLSRGMTSMVGIVVGLASRARLTLFDEPYLGLDAVARQQFYDLLLADYAAHPRTIVISTHLIEEIADLLEHVVLIDQGRVLLAQDTDSLRARGTVVSGNTAEVDRLAHAGHELARESLGGLTRVTIDGLGHEEWRAALDAGLSVTPLSLQQLIVALTRHSTQGHPRSSARPTVEVSS